MDTTPEVWDLPIIGYRVLTIEFSGRLGVIAYGTRLDGERYAPSSGLYFGGSFVMYDQGGARRNLDATSPWESLTVLLTLRHRVVVAAVADDTSQIEITFDDGAKLMAGRNLPMRTGSWLDPEDSIWWRCQVEAIPESRATCTERGETSACCIPGSQT